MRRDQYILKNAFRQPMTITSTTRGSSKIDLTERRWVDKQLEPQSEGLITFFNPKHVSAILCYYNALKTSTRGSFQNDFYYLIEAFDELWPKALAEYPAYRDIVEWKWKEKTNIEIHDLLFKKYGINHSAEYISSLWRNKIPKIIAEYEKDRYLIWHFTYEEEGAWKICSCCGQNKLAHNRFFSKNNTSKDGFYSQCKKCRNARNKIKSKGGN